MPKVDLTEAQMLVLIAAAAQVEPEWEDEAADNDEHSARARRDLATLNRACKRLAAALPTRNGHRDA